MESKAENEVLEQDKLLLSHDLMRLIGKFLTDHSDEVVGAEIRITTCNPTMTMTENGKFHTGRTLLCTVNTWGEPDDDDYFEDD